MRILALALVVLGLVGLLYGGVSWTERDKVLDVGPVEVTTEDQKRFPIAPVAAGLMLVVGAGLLLSTRKAH